MRLTKMVVLLFISVLAFPAIAETRLIMIEEEGCVWCIQWNNDVGGEYAITLEGKIAPLWRHNISDPTPEGVAFSSPPQYTPTFILLVDGEEVNRIEGYPGEGFFWGLLELMLANLSESEGFYSGS